MDIWFQCTECIFATNSPKAATKHTADTTHTVAPEKQLELGPLVQSATLGGTTPRWIKTPEGYTFDWAEDDGMYANRGPEAVFLYIEGEVLTPSSYYEIS